MDMELVRWNGNIKSVNLALGTLGNSRINLSTLTDRTQSGVDDTTGVTIDPKRDYYMVITGAVNYFCTIDRQNTTTPSATSFQFYGSDLKLIRAGHADTDNKDLYLHALVGAGSTVISILAFPLQDMYYPR